MVETLKERFESGLWRCGDCHVYYSERLECRLNNKYVIRDPNDWCGKFTYLWYGNTWKKELENNAKEAKID